MPVKQQQLFNSGTTKSMRLPKSSKNSGLSQPVLLPTKSSLLVAATGLGKTMMMAALANHWPVGRVLLISHRFELNKQAIKEFERYCCEPVSLEQASYRADDYGMINRIVVGSVPTLNSRSKGVYRMEKFDPMDFGLLLIDEAHHSTSTSYRQIVKHFTKNPDLRVVGVTATPDRLDKVGLGCVYDHVAVDYNIGWAIENGWLVSPKQKFVSVDNFDLSSVETRKSELHPKQLAKIMEIESNLHGIAKPIVDLCGNEQCIVFAASVRQARRLAELIKDYHHRKHGSCPANLAISLDGKLKPSDALRQSIVRDFKDGNIQYLVNMGVATEGFDAPNVGVIAIARPTKSRALYTQMIGRGCRPLAGVVDGPLDAASRKTAIAASAKPHCLVLDFIGQSGRHDLVCTTDILGGSEPDSVRQRADQEIRKKGFQGTTYEAILMARAAIATENEARRSKVTVGVDYSVVDVNGRYEISMIPRSRGRNYLQRFKVSEKQNNFLLKLGYKQFQINKMNLRSASDAIDHAIKNPINEFGQKIKAKKAKEQDDT